VDASALDAKIYRGTEAAQAHAGVLSQLSIDAVAKQDSEGCAANRLLAASRQHEGAGVIGGFRAAESEVAPKGHNESRNDFKSTL
jgi:hypothetical protein